VLVLICFVYALDVHSDVVPALPVVTWVEIDVSDSDDGIRNMCIQYMYILCHSGSTACETAEFIRGALLFWPQNRTTTVSQ
jgi:hypothetical protein